MSQFQALNDRLTAEIGNRNQMFNELSNIRSMVTTMATSSCAQSTPATLNYGPQGITPRYQIPGNFNDSPNNFSDPATRIPTPPNLHEILLQLNSLEQRYMNSQRTLYAMQQEVNNLKQDVVTIKDTQNKDRQYSQRYSILIKGLDDVPIAPKKPTRDYKDKFTQYVIDKLNTLLPNLENEVVKSDIDNTHVYRTKKLDPKGSKQIVIVKFVSVLRRDELYSIKKSLKDTGVSMTEHLTKTNLAIYRAAQNAAPDYKKVWTHYGTTLVELNGSIRSIRSMEDVERLLNPPSEQFQYRRKQFPSASVTTTNS